MLRDGLRAELPELFDLASRARPVRVPRAAVWIAVLGALGMRGLVLESVRWTLLDLGLMGLPSIRTAEASTVFANAVALLFAFGAAGWPGVRGTVALFAALWGADLATGSVTAQQFCAQSRANEAPLICDLVTRALNGGWPIAVGVIVGIVSRGVVRGGERGYLAVAVGAGASSLFLAAARPVAVALVGTGPVAPGAPESARAIALSVATSFIAAALFGAVAGYLGRRHRLNALIVGAYYLLPAIYSFALWQRTVLLPPFARPPVPISPAVSVNSDWEAYVGFAYAMVAALALLVAALIRERKARDDA